MQSKRIILASAALAQLAGQAIADDYDVGVEVCVDDPVVDLYKYKQQPALSKKSQRRTHPTSWRK